jgi:hypothetical protein
MLLHGCMFFKGRVRQDPREELAMQHHLLFCAS